MKLLDFLIKFQEDTNRIKKAHNAPELFLFFTGSYAAIASLIDVIRISFPDTELTPGPEPINGD